MTSQIPAGPKQAALAAIPTARLQAAALATHVDAAAAAAAAAAQTAFRSGGGPTTTNSHATRTLGLGERDYFLKELLKWFKDEFFTWVDTLPCGDCGGKTAHAGSTAPTAADTAAGAGRVELHQCTTHPAHPPTRFPRYNDPVKLLSARRGRCGEWVGSFLVSVSSLPSRQSSLRLLLLCARSLIG